MLLRSSSSESWFSKRVLSERPSVRWNASVRPARVRHRKRRRVLDCGIAWRDGSPPDLPVTVERHDALAERVPAALQVLSLAYIIGELITRPIRRDPHRYGTAGRSAMPAAAHRMVLAAAQRTTLQRLAGHALRTTGASVAQGGDLEMISTSCCVRAGVLVVLAAACSNAVPAPGAAPASPAGEVTPWCP